MTRPTLPFLTHAQCQVVLDKLNRSGVPGDISGDVQSARMLGIFHRAKHEGINDPALPTFTSDQHSDKGMSDGEETRLWRAVKKFIECGAVELRFGLAYRDGFVFPLDLDALLCVWKLRLPATFLAAVGVHEDGTAIVPISPDDRELVRRKIGDLCERYGISKPISHDLPSFKVSFKGVKTYPVEHEFGALREPAEIFGQVTVVGLPCVTVDESPDLDHQGLMAVAAGLPGPNPGGKVQVFQGPPHAPLGEVPDQEPWRADLAETLGLLGEWMDAAKTTEGQVAAVRTGLEERTAALLDRGASTGQLA